MLLFIREKVIPDATSNVLPWLNSGECNQRQTIHRVCRAHLRKRSKTARISLLFGPGPFQKLLSPLRRQLTVRGLGNRNDCRHIFIETFKRRMGRTFDKRAYLAWCRHQPQPDQEAVRQSSGECYCVAF